MKSKRTFWILPELSKMLDKISGPNGDGRTITWHLEQALKKYFTVGTPKQEVSDKNNNKYSDEDLRLAKHIYRRVLDVAPKTKKPNFDNWADTIRLMVKSDKHDHREIFEVFTWANKDIFWCTNILSPAKLRKQYASLHAKMNAIVTTVQPQSPVKNLTDKSWADHLLLQNNEGDDHENKI